MPLRYCWHLDVIQVILYNLSLKIECLNHPAPKIKWTVKVSISIKSPFILCVQLKVIVPLNKVHLVRNDVCVRQDRICSSVSGQLYEDDRSMDRFWSSGNERCISLQMIFIFMYIFFFHLKSNFHYTSHTLHNVIV